MQQVLLLWHGFSFVAEKRVSKRAQCGWTDTTKVMANSFTHFEIYGDQPVGLAEFYRSVFGWDVEQMPGIDYWQIKTGSAESRAVNGGLTYRAVPGLNGWMLYINVVSLDETVELVQRLGGTIVRPKTAVPKAAWVTIVADPAQNIFGVWQADPAAFPLPMPD
jgi:uncharacterized protein